MKLKPGIYETVYGNAAIVEDWDDEIAWDIDMAEEVMIEMVTDIFIREID